MTLQFKTWLKAYCRHNGLDYRVFGDEMEWMYIPKTTCEYTHIHHIEDVMPLSHEFDIITTCKMEAITLVMQPYTAVNVPGMGSCKTIFMAVCNCNKIFWSV